MAHAGSSRDRSVPWTTPSPFGPICPIPEWAATASTLHLWTQIVGKVRLSLTPWVNHGWQVPLYVTARGLGTSTIPFGSEIVEIEFDFIAQRLLARTSAGAQASLPLEPQPVADFYARVVDLLGSVGVTVSINELPIELPRPIRFSHDRPSAPTTPPPPIASGAHWCRSIACFSSFAAAFLGKVSPVHFFWGSFDLAVTRFSGRTAPLHPGGVPGLPDTVTREAYSHEVSSAGFWPGNEASRWPRSTPMPIRSPLVSPPGR